MPRAHFVRPAPLASLLIAAMVVVSAAACDGDALPATSATETPVATASPATTEPPAITPHPEPTPTFTATPSPTPEAPGSGTSTQTSQAAAPVIPPPAVPTVVIEQVTLTSPVDKVRGLPAGYVPPGLTRVPDEWVAPGFEGQLLRYVVVQALERLRATAEADGIDLRVRSAYRSYEHQVWTFAHWVNVHGLEHAERISARPGHSEHQLGTTIDFTSPSMNWQLGAGFADTPEGRWLAEHGHRFGFALSYPRGAEHITGYVFEPWHWRYIGEEAAQAWFEAGRPPLITFLDQLGGS